MLLRLCIHLWIFSFLFLNLCAAINIPCTVTQDGERWSHSVRESKELSWDYKWFNMNNYTLANGDQRTVGPNVVSRTNWNLVTNKCFELIYLTRTSFPEGIQETATCISNCSGNSAVPIRGDIAHWIVPTVIAVVLGLLGLLGLCYWFKDPISRWLCTK